MRDREKILSNLEEMYREAYDRAKEEDDDDGMAALDLRFQRDQLVLEALLDIRALLARQPTQGGEGEGERQTKEESLLDKAERLRRITRLR
ncbi:MAG: hypothetical protein R3223_02290 [Longimicrobiales bacterium]|nr:hypothetical protein [Longimicrobiales bacterium]